MSSAGPEQGEEVEGPAASVTDARGAVRTGRNIWILVISLGLAIVLLIGFWLVHSPRFAHVDHPQGRDLNAHDISTFNTPAGSAREAPPGAPSTETNGQ